MSDTMGLDWLAANDPSFVSPAMKAAVTKTLDHGDMDQTFLGDYGLGFQGDFSEGEGELVAVVSYKHNVGQRRGRRGGRRRNRRTVR